MNSETDKKEIVKYIIENKKEFLLGSDKGIHFREINANKNTAEMNKFLMSEESPIKKIGMISTSPYINRESGKLIYYKWGRGMDDGLRKICKDINNMFPNFMTKHNDKSILSGVKTVKYGKEIIDEVLQILELDNNKKDIKKEKKISKDINENIADRCFFGNKEEEEKDDNYDIKKYKEELKIRIYDLLPDIVDPKISVIELKLYVETIIG